MNFKFGVKYDGLAFPMWFALGFIELECRNLFNSECTITSLQDGTHMEGSLHTSGNAADIRIKDLTLEQAQMLCIHLKSFLGPYGFDIVLEKDHVHVEYDPKGRQLFRWVD